MIDARNNGGDRLVVACELAIHLIVQRASSWQQTRQLFIYNDGMEQMMLLAALCVDFEITHFLLRSLIHALRRASDSRPHFLMWIPSSIALRES